MEQMSETSDEMLFIAYCQGDSGSLKTLFNRYQHRLCRHIECMLNDKPAAEDVVIETFLRLHHYRHRYRVGENFRGWVYTIARNLARNWLRKERVRRWLPLTMKVSTLYSESPSTAENQDIRRRVADAFSKLPYRQREVCSLRLMGEFSLGEIAQVVNVSLGTVKSRLFYGQQRLRDLLSDLDPKQT